jgi:hypothetical protein
MPGTCYQDAYSVLLDCRDGIELVHGYPRCTNDDPKLSGKKFGHAWLEYRGVVLDAASGNFIEAGVYYDVGNINPAECRRYTLNEALKLASEQGHYGPWEPPPADACFANQPAIDQHFKRKRVKR